MKRLAIIPARGGSKRIPRKNIKPFLGRPIIAYSIEAALQSGCFEEVMVSTDDAQVVEIARSYGATVPFMRSAETAGDQATTAAALIEVLSQYARRGTRFNQACCIYPAAPFITAARLRESLTLMEAERADSCIPVYHTPMWRALRIDQGRLTRIWPEYQNTRSQDLPDTYHDAGQFYWFDVSRFMREGRILNDDTVPFVLSATEVQDIDTLDDWLIAEAKYQASQRGLGKET